MAKRTAAPPKWTATPEKATVPWRSWVSVIVVGALIAAGPVGVPFHKVMGFIAVILASVNIFGGFIVTQRMLGMFKKKAPTQKTIAAKA